MQASNRPKQGRTSLSTFLSDLQINRFLSKSQPNPIDEHFKGKLSSSGTFGKLKDYLGDLRESFQQRKINDQERQDQR